ncbi:hypothetical protein LTR37_019028 [Vermiconidia calcicola]|uniref:Uncharacterized protein n=1 Tax=Vermiconidia calcicola TaxID=1690605 RepID=A0ACC3MF84_9PEZI|nr:hypothetical protein LTR37_019028 [Vermiconidia calcicola]
MALTQTLTNNLPSLKPPSTPQPPQQRSRPYKDFLTPALHRRFTRAALLVFAACYLASLLLRPPGLLWLWNPLSATGTRACMLFLSCLAVFIVRVANVHCGELVAASPAESAWAAVVGWRGVVTLGWYVYSACFFGEVYIWSRDNAAGLGWVDHGREDEWALLNENPIFLRAVFFCLAVAQTAVHLGRGEDRIPIPVKEEAPMAAQQQQTAASKVPKSLQALQARLPAIGLRTLKLAIPTLAFTLPVYFLILRPLLWPYFYTIGHFFFQSKLAQQSRPTGLTDVPRLVWQCLTSSATLILLWEISNATFTIHVARPPLSKAGDEPLTGLMITGEKGKDPNGSLISGLKAKKEVPRTFAFWELSLICTHYPTRRKTIYTEVDRAGGSTWSQISTLCLNEISSIQSRIQAAQTPPAQQQPQSQEQTQQQQPYLGLPKIADRSVQSGDVWAQPQHQSMQSVANMAKSIGQSPGAQNPALPKARKAIEWGADHVFTQENQARLLSREGINKEVSGFAVKILRTPPGEVFRQTFGRRVKGVVFGGDAPYGSEASVIHASRALSILCMQSLKEGDYGQVAESIATVIRTYVSTIKAIEAFVAGWAPSWTDVGFTEEDRKIKEVEDFVGVLKEGLEGVVLAFGEYASSLGLEGRELREARGVVGKGQGQGQGQGQKQGRELAEAR